MYGMLGLILLFGDRKLGYQRNLIRLKLLESSESSEE